MIKLLIAGSRSIKDQAKVFEILDKYLLDNSLQNIEVVSGKAAGVDTLAIEWATARDRPCRDFPAKWDDLSASPCIVATNKHGKKYNKLAGFNRNTEMADYADLAIVIHNGSNGSLDMIEKMRERNKPVTEVLFD